MSARVLRRSDVVELIDPITLNLSMRAAFSDYSTARSIPGRRFFTPLSGPGDVMILAPGLSPGVPAYSVKIHAKFPNEEPAISGLLMLNDLQSGSVLAVMDSTYLTAVRTGLGSAIATDLLARDDARRVAVLGAGTQGRFQLRYLNLLRSISTVTVYDISGRQALAFQKDMQHDLGLNIFCCDSLASALLDADIILCATWAKEPLLYADMIKPGCHITTLGADQPNEAEISAELINQALFVCDDRDLAISMGAIGGAGLGMESIDAEIGDVISGHHPGRTESDQITIYGAVGVAFQDLVAGWQVYQSACAQNIGQSIDLLA